MTIAPLAIGMQTEYSKFVNESDYYKAICNKLEMF